MMPAGVQASSQRRASIISYDSDTKAVACKTSMLERQYRETLRWINTPSYKKKHKNRLVRQAGGTQKMTNKSQSTMAFDSQTNQRLIQGELKTI